MCAVASAIAKDATLLVPTRWANGFMMGIDNSPSAAGLQRQRESVRRSFGRLGSGGSIGFADPAARLSFAYVMNKQGGGTGLEDRGQALVDAVYRTLGYRRAPPAACGSARTYIQAGLYVKVLGVTIAVRPASDFDPFSLDLVADPYPWYAGLHAGPRVLHLEKWDIWVLSRHADITAAVRDHVRLSSEDGVTFIKAPLPMMLTMDPPDHERLRRIAGREFAPRDIDRFRPAIEVFVKDGLDAMASGDVGDVVEHLAIPIPIRVMAFILGVPDADIPDLRRMADDLIHGFKLNPGELEVPGTGAELANYNFSRIGGAITEIHDYFRAMIEERRRKPAEDLVTRLIQPADEGTLNENELLWFCLLLLVAGIETTTNLIGNMTIALASNPDQWRALRTDPELVGSTVNEALRYDPPIQGFYRGVRAGYAVDDVEIPVGSRVLLSFGAANRDPIHYPDPNAFKADRNPVDHIAFGGGIHRCLGAGLAELESRVVLEQLVERADVIEIAGEVVRTTNPTLRGAQKLPVKTASWR